MHQKMREAAAHPWNPCPSRTCSGFDLRIQEKIIARAHSLDQQQRRKTSSGPVQHIEQSKCIKLTIDTNMQLTLYKALHFSEGPKKIVKYFKLMFKNVSFPLLNGWNVTKTSFDHA